MVISQALANKNRILFRPILVIGVSSQNYPNEATAKLHRAADFTERETLLNFLLWTQIFLFSAVSINIGQIVLVHFQLRQERSTTAGVTPRQLVSIYLMDPIYLVMCFDPSFGRLSCLHLAQDTQIEIEASCFCNIELASQMLLALANVDPLTESFALKTIVATNYFRLAITFMSSLQGTQQFLFDRTKRQASMKMRGRRLSVYKAPASYTFCCSYHSWKIKK